MPVLTISNVYLAVSIYVALVLKQDVKLDLGMLRLELSIIVMCAMNSRTLIYACVVCKSSLQYFGLEFLDEFLVGLKLISIL